MDQWTEAAYPPVLRAVSGGSMRVLRRPGDLDAELEATEPDGIRVLVVSDDMLARRGMLAALDDQPGLTVVGDRRPGPAGAAAIRSTGPDVLLLHGLTAEEAEPALTAARAAGVRVIAVGARADLSTVDHVVISGQLPASSTPDEVVAAVRMAAAGYVLGRGAAPRPTGGRAAALARGLTERECDVLALVAAGMTNAEIAAALTLSEHTVKSHVQNLLGKLRLRNRIQAVIYAFDTGIVRSGGGDSPAT